MFLNIGVGQDLKKTDQWIIEEIHPELSLEEQMTRLKLSRYTIEDFFFEEDCNAGKDGRRGGGRR